LQTAADIASGTGYSRTVTSGAHHLALGGDDRQAEHVLAHRPVADRVGARGAGRGHAPERGVGARVDREEEPGVLDLGVQLLARDARLHGAQQVLGRDRQHPVHARDVDREAALDREQVALERGADPERDDREAVLPAGEHRLDDVLGRLGEHHRVGRRDGERRLVAAVVLADRERGAEAVAEAGAQPFGERVGQRAPERPGGGVGMVHGGVPP
jgi:hypothetical protein